MAIKNISLTNLADISFVQVGYDTDGNFEDYEDDSNKFLSLTPTRGSTATFSATNSEANGITQINVIKLISESYTVLAYRTIGYTIDVIKADDAIITVTVTLDTTVIGEQIGSIELNYLEHSLQLPKNVHDKIDELPFQQIDTISSNNFPSILETKIQNEGVDDFDPSADDKLQRAYGTPAYYAGRGRTYSNLLWYYWNPSKINEFLTTLASKWTGNLAAYTASLPSKISMQKPMLGFNARYGSYLYWYNISTDYVCVIYVGSNHYNAVDVFIVPNTKGIAPKECVFWNENTKEFRIKINRWYNHLYFVADGQAYQINTNLEDGHEIYIQQVEDSFGYNDSLLGDKLTYNIRAFQTDVADSIQLENLFPPSFYQNDHYWQLEFSDIGDVLIHSCELSGIKFFGLKNIFNDSSHNYWIDLPIIDATQLYDAEQPLFNRYSIDNQDRLPRLWGLYQTTLVHLQYFLKNDYTPLYLGAECSIGWSNTYQNYLTLFKVPTVAARRRTPSTWLTGCQYIEQGKIGRIGSLENMATGNIEEMSGYLAAERGVCVKKSDFGAYREVQ